MVIYVHLCEKGKFYVGSSGQGPDANARMVNRLRQHIFQQKVHIDIMKKI